VFVGIVKQLAQLQATQMAELPKAAQGTFDELLAGVEPGLAAIARRLRALIRAVDVSTVETVRLGDNAATYGVGPKKMTDGYAYIMPMRGQPPFCSGAGGSGTRPATEWCHRSGPGVHSAPLEVSKATS
jgi:hypothetical protein